MHAGGPLLRGPTRPTTQDQAHLQAGLGLWCAHQPPEATKPGDKPRQKGEGADVHCDPCSNHPIDNLEVEDEEVSEVEKLKDEGNEFFVCKKYQKALTK